MLPNGQRLPSLHMYFCLNNCWSQFSVSVNHWRNYRRRPTRPAERGPFSSHIARLGALFVRSSRGPEIWSCAAGVDFVFVFQEDKFYPPPHLSSKRFKFQAKMIQYVCDQVTLEVGTTKLIPPINEMMLIWWYRIYFLICFTRGVKY